MTTPLWQPGEERIRTSNLSRSQFMAGTDIGLEPALGAQEAAAASDALHALSVSYQKNRRITHTPIN